MTPPGRREHGTVRGQEARRLAVTGRRGVRDGRVHIGLRDAGTAPRDDLRLVSVSREPLVAVLPSDHRLADLAIALPAKPFPTAANLTAPARGLTR